MELPVSLYSIPDLWAAAGRMGLGALGRSPACLVGVPAAGREGRSLLVLEEGVLRGDRGQRQRRRGDHHVQPKYRPARPGYFWSVSALNCHRRFP